MSDTDWYLLDRGGRRYGPYDRGLIERLAAQRELTPATPVWHPGLARWQRADRVLALPRAERIEAAAAPATASAPDHVAARPVRAPQPRPGAARTAAMRPVGRPATQPKIPAALVAKITSTPMTPPQAARRIFATLFDLMCVYAVFRLLGKRVPGGGIEALTRLGPLFFFLWAVLDAAWTTRLASTPGKALMGIRILAARDEKLDWPHALLRSGPLPLLLLMLTLRTGFTILVAVAVLFFTARRLRSGFAPWWDDIAGARVSYGELTAPRQVLAFVAFLVGLFIVILVVP